jgi:single-strand DNA-binding protein
VVGRLKQDRWIGADGKARSKITIVAEHVEFRPEFKRGEYHNMERSNAAPAGVPEEEAPPGAPEFTPVEEFEAVNF